MSFTEYVIACERLVFDMKTFHWFIIKDLIKPYKHGVTPERFVKSFYKQHELLNAIATDGI